jgi:hypothetical protein
MLSNRASGHALLWGSADETPQIHNFGCVVNFTPGRFDPGKETHMQIPNV